MTKQLTNPVQRPLRDLIADDSYVMAFQTVGHYRKALLQHADALTAQQAEVAATKLNRATQLDDSQGEGNE
jgi:hypothetical protein